MTDQLDPVSLRIVEEDGLCTHVTEPLDSRLEAEGLEALQLGLEVCFVDLEGEVVERRAIDVEAHECVRDVPCRVHQREELGVSSSPERRIQVAHSKEHDRGIRIRESAVDGEFERPLVERLHPGNVVHVDHDLGNALDRAHDQSSRRLASVLLKHKSGEVPQPVGPDRLAQGAAQRSPGAAGPRQRGAPRGRTPVRVLRRVVPTPRRGDGK